MDGDFVFNKPSIGITLKGGYNCDYSSSSSATLLSGSLTISNGTITIDGIVIR